MKLKDIEIGVAYRMRSAGLFIPLCRSATKRASFDGAWRRHEYDSWEPTHAVHLSAFRESDAAATQRADARWRQSLDRQRRERDELIRRWGAVYDLARAVFGDDHVDLDSSLGEAYVEVEPRSKAEGLRLVVALTRRLGHPPSEYRFFDEVGHDVVLLLAGLEASAGLVEPVRLSGEVEITALRELLEIGGLEDLLSDGSLNRV